MMRFVQSQAPSTQRSMASTMPIPANQSISPCQSRGQMTDTIRDPSVADDDPQIRLPSATPKARWNKDQQACVIATKHPNSLRFPTRTTPMEPQQAAKVSCFYPRSFPAPLQIDETSLRL